MTDPFTDLTFLFQMARFNPKCGAGPIAQRRRLQGRHCTARLQRGQDKRIAVGKRVFA